jgi:hypothetical protein
MCGGANILEPAAFFRFRVRGKLLPEVIDLLLRIAGHDEGYCFAESEFVLARRIHRRKRKPDDPSPAEQKMFRKNEEWLQKEGAYALIQSTKPQSLATGLNDSPARLAAWIVEKFRAWSDCGGDVESRFTRDELLTNVMIYWRRSRSERLFWPTSITQMPARLPGWSKA